MAGGRFSWFPGHMAKALKQIEQRLKLVDLVVEVRDARVPFSSANPELARLTGHKRRLVVLNKIDMADAATTKASCTLLQSQGLRVIPCVALRDGSAGKVLDAALGWLQRDRPRADLSLMLVAGVPNTGKSSLINALKRAAKREGLLEGEQAYNKTARSGPLPGVTRQMGGFKVCHDPLVYVLDTPGVLSPVIRDEWVAMRLALAGLLPGDGGLGLDEGILLKYLVQMLVSEPSHQRQLWCAADGQLSVPRRGADDVALGAKAGSFGDRRREARAMGLARLLYDVVTVRDLRPQRWHPGLDGEDDSHYDDSMQGGVVGPCSSSATDAEHRVAELLRRMSRGSVMDVGRRAAAQRSVLQAFRDGALGSYTLDSVEEEAARSEGGGVEGSGAWEKATAAAAAAKAGADAQVGWLPS